MEQTKQCPKCGKGMTLMYNNEDEDDSSFWVCYICGIDIPFTKNPWLNNKGYDEYWNPSEDEQASEELDEYFYEKYPQFRKED